MLRAGAYAGAGVVGANDDDIVGVISVVSVTFCGAHSVVLVCGRLTSCFCNEYAPTLSQSEMLKPMMEPTHAPSQLECGKNAARMKRPRLGPPMAPLKAREA